MDEHENDIHRLLRAALPPEARPDSDLRRETWQLLAGELRSRRAPSDFPSLALGAIIAVLLVAALWSIGYLLGGQAVSGGELPLMGMILLLVINLSLVPVAALVIVIMRKAERS